LYITVFVAKVCLKDYLVVLEYLPNHSSNINRVNIL